MLSAILGFAASVIPAISAPVAKYQERKAQVVQVKHEARLERIRAQKGDFKDEFLLGIWSMPLLIAVSPWQEYSFEMFERLAKLPDWYMGGFVGISFAIFGVDKIFKGFKK